MMRDARSWSREPRCRRAVSAANLHPADSGTAPGPRRARLERTGILHVLLLHGLQSLAASCMAEERRPLCWNVREPSPCMSGPQKCPRQSSSSPAALFPAAFQSSPFLRQRDPRRASYIRYHNPCFQGRVPVFWFKQMVSSWKLAEKKKWQHCSAYTALIDRGGTTVQ